MRIAVNTRFLLKDRLEGIGLYTHEVCRRLVQDHPEVSFHFLFDRPYEDHYIYGSNVHPHVLFPPARHPLLWYWWFEWSLPAVLTKIQPDIFLSPDGFSSIRYTGKKATVIHDLGFEHFPEHVPSLVGKFYRKFTPRYAKTSDHIFCVSKATLDDIAEQYGISTEKMSVAYNGIREGFKPLTSDAIENVRKKIAEGQPYFLFVGALHPRKNISHLLRSFDKFCDDHPGYKLVVTGRKAWMTAEMETTLISMKHGDDVIFTGYQTREELIKTTAAAFTCLYPSLFEGFGVPLLEAMTSGVPVITSNISAMPEVTGEAALLIDPSSEEATVDAMRRMVRDTSTRTECIKKGLDQSRKFSWQVTADQIFNKLSLLTGYNR